MSAKKLVLLLIVAAAMLAGCTRNTEKPIDNNNVNTEDKPSGVVNEAPTENEPNTSETPDTTDDEYDDFEDMDEILEVDRIMFIENVKEYLDNDDYSLFESEEVGQMADEVLTNYMTSDSYEYDKSVTVEENRFVNAGACLDAFSAKTIGDTAGISLLSMMDGLKIRESKTYIVVGKGNFTIGVALDNLKNGMLYVDENGSYCVKFEGMSDKTIVKDVLYISVEN